MIYHRGKHNESSCEIKDWKKFRPERDSNTWPLRYRDYQSRLHNFPRTSNTACFEKCCLSNGEKLTRQRRKLLWVMVVFTVAQWTSTLVNLQRGGRKQHRHVFVLSRSLLLHCLEPQSSKDKLLLPIVQIGIVAYAFTLPWDNLCRNSCIHDNLWYVHLQCQLFLDFVNKTYLLLLLNLIKQSCLQRGCSRPDSCVIFEDSTTGLVVVHSGELRLIQFNIIW